MNSAKPIVAHVTSVHPALDNRIFFKECVALANAGFNVHLIGPYATDELKQGVTIHAIQRLGALKRLVKSFPKIIWMLRQIRPEIVHLHDPELLLLKPLLRLLGITVIYDMHEWFSKQLLIKERIKKPLRKPMSYLGRIYERLLINRGPVVFAENSYVDAFPYVQDYCVALNMPDTQFVSQFNNSDKHGVFTVGYVGGVTRARGCLKIAKVLVELKNQGHKVGYVCIGGFEDSVLEKELRDIGDTLDYFEAPGFIAFEEAIPLIAKAHIGVAVLDNTPNYYQSYPTKIFEYMALGMPFLVSDFPINRAVAEETGAGIPVDPNDVNAILKGIKSLLESPEKFREMKAQALTNAEKYSWHPQKEALVSFYQDHLRETRTN